MVDSFFKLIFAAHIKTGAPGKPIAFDLENSRYTIDYEHPNHAPIKTAPMVIHGNGITINASWSACGCPQRKQATVYGDIEQCYKLDDSMKSVAELIAFVWYKDQIRDMSADFYMFHRSPRPGETYATPIVATELPNHEWVRSIDRPISKMLTPAENSEIIFQRMRTLPIIQWRKNA